MTDGNKKIFGSPWNDAQARLTGSQYLGQPFVVSPTNALNPATGFKVGSTKNLKNEDSK